MTKTFGSRILEQFPAAEAEKAKMVGFIINGMDITVLKMTFNNGSVPLISMSERLVMPEPIRQVPSLLPPVLTLVYSCARIVKGTMEYLEVVEPSSMFGHSQGRPFFITVTNTNKKRKILLS